MVQDHKALPSETRRLFALLRISRRPGLQALANSPFRHIPPEILQNIVAHLPLVSAVCFSLCCQPLAASLGPRYLTEIRLLGPRTPDKNAFDCMALLSRDLPHMTECYRCMAFHNDYEVQKHIPSNWHYLYPPPCWKGPKKEWSYDFGWDHRERYLLHYNFSISTFQTTMRHYREGLEYRDLFQSLTLPTTTSSRPHVGKRVVQHSSRPQIVNGSLLLRTKVAFLEPGSDFRTAYFIICPHSGILNSNSHAVERFQTIVSRTVKYRQWSLFDKSENPECRRAAREMHQHNEVDLQFAPGKLHQCNHCATEFRIDFKTFEGYGSAMFVTKWQDLGDGEDEKWQSQLVGLDGRTNTLVPFEAGSICKAFEENRGEEGSNGANDEWYLTRKDKEELLGTTQEIEGWREDQYAFRNSGQSKVPRRRGRRPKDYPRRRRRIVIP